MFYQMLRRSQTKNDNRFVSLKALINGINLIIEVNTFYKRPKITLSDSKVWIMYEPLVSCHVKMKLYDPLCTHGLVYLG